jgi:cytochrome c551/c552
MKTKVRFLTMVLMTLSLVPAIRAQDGSALFKNNCASCHTIGKGKLVGPDLKDVGSKHTEVWLLNWVKSSQSMVKKGDKEAIAVFKANNMIPMPDQAIPAGDVKAIFGFVTSSGDITKEGAGQSISVDESASSVTATVVPAHAAESIGVQGESTRVSPMVWLFIVVVSFLVLVIYILSRTITVLARRNSVN